MTSGRPESVRVRPGARSSLATDPRPQMNKLLHEADNDDPLLTVVNLIDIFLVLIAALLITVARNPLMNPFSKRDVTVITDPGKPNMEIVVKKGEKAGVAYRMKDGSIVYVPEGGLP